MVGGSSGPFEFPWEWSICPVLQIGDVVQPLRFLAFTTALTSHDPQLIWTPENPKPALHSFFVFYVLFSSVELLLSGGALSTLLAC